MKRGLSRLSKRLFRKGQPGQTLVILAFGFIVLLAFVGIVTDVSLMFVRYSSLRRAVDAAAVSAAGQMRRAAPTDEDITKAKSVNMANWENLANGYAFARNVANVNLAARQFIEFYGLNPRTVLVDTCATMPTDPLLECNPDEQPRKLVKVTAQVNSPTVFLRLIGWGDVVLEASAISETAVLDVVMIFDVSESMANQTSYRDWDAIGQTVHYLPPRMYLPGPASDQYPNFPTIMNQVYGGDFNQAWLQTLSKNQDQLNLDAGYNSRPYTVTYDANGNVLDVFQATSGDLSSKQPREECRVRFFPSAEFFRIPDGTEEFAFDNVQQEYTRYMWKFIPGYASTDYPPRDPVTGSNNTDHVKNPPRYDGFVPAYNYFGCCNDPGLAGNTAADFAFDDLICQPMGKVRDASEDFLNRIDFSRGDRVAFVTFDRSAYLVDPDGTTGGDGTGPQTHMMTSQSNAVEALRQIVGVRAEPNFYADTDGDGLWDSFVRGGAPYAGDPNQLVDYNTMPVGYDTTPLGSLNEYPVKDNCRYQNATLAYPRSIYSSPIPPNYATNNPRNIGRYPNPIAAAYPGQFDSLMWPPLNDPAWRGQMPFQDSSRPFFMAYYAYERQAGCRGSNIGAALRVSNNALVDPNTIRTSGAVWVMVMLGDGAAAGTDPVKRNGATLTGPDYYSAPYNALDDTKNYPPIKGQYGVFGVCPYGRPTALGPLVDADPANGSTWSRNFPYCMDTDPASRHFCFDPRVRDTSGIYIDIGRVGCDVDYYDADDFARDWADFVGLTDPFPALVTEDELNRTDLILPTIFTIGFGLDFSSKKTGTNQERCDANIGDCLGEELLRYIADVGDNNQIDTDYQQDYRDNGSVDKSIETGGYGGRGPCEGPLLGGYTDIDLVPSNQMGNIENPLPVGESCGNYFNAPTAEELQNVFDTIASRMFTRLTR